MVIDFGVFLIKQVILISLLMSLPLLWLFLAGRIDVAEQLLNGTFSYTTFSSLCSASLRDVVHASGITAILGGGIYNCLGWSLSVLHIPFVGALDRVIAKTFMILGCVVLVLAYKLDLYS
jgi:hypothetical protein